MDILEIEGIGPEYKEKLSAAGIHTTDELLKRGATPKARKEIEKVTGIGHKLIFMWVKLADLSRVNGVGEEYSELLEEAGVNSVSELAQQNADKLFERIIDIHNNKKIVRRPPKLSIVKDWIKQAKILPGIIVADESKKEVKLNKRNKIIIFSSAIIVFIAIALGIVFANINNKPDSNLSAANDAKAGIETTTVLMVAKTTQATNEIAVETTIKADETTTSNSAPNGAVTTQAAETTTISSTATTASVGPLKVHFIDVGQGDSILIQTPDGKTMLIDGGPKSSGSSVVAYLKKLGITKINVMVATHPHEDHIGGLIDVINNFAVDNIIDSGNSHTTVTFKDYLNAIKANNINFVVPDLGQEFDIGQSVKMQILGPINITDDLNNSSLVIKLTYGSTSFLFTGDAQNQEENQILSKGYDLSSQVLKVGHHGSASSSGVNFLKAVSSTIGVISCGENNSYGHPDNQTLQNLTSVNAVIYRTDLAGSIIIESGGDKINVLQGSPYDYAPDQTTTTQSQQTTTTSSSTTTSVAETTTTQTSGGPFVGSKNSDVYHYPDCGSAQTIKPGNLVTFGSVEEAKSAGYRPCKKCNPPG
ncbi:MAG: DUF4332 domain-containing protein [Candidatus Humimicrobiaceae bacterium]